MLAGAEATSEPPRSRVRDRRAAVKAHIRELRLRLTQGAEMKPEFAYELLSLFVRNELSARVTVRTVARHERHSRRSRWRRRQRHVRLSRPMQRRRACRGGRQP